MTFNWRTAAVGRAEQHPNALTLFADTTYFRKLSTFKAGEKGCRSLNSPSLASGTTIAALLGGLGLVSAMDDATAAVSHTIGSGDSSNGYGLDRARVRFLTVETRALGNVPNPTSPLYANITKLYSEKRRVNAPCTPAQLAAQPRNRTVGLTIG